MQIYKYKYTNANIQIQIYKCKDTKTQIHRAQAHLCNGLWMAVVTLYSGDPWSHFTILPRKAEPL